MATFVVHTVSCYGSSPGSENSNNRRHLLSTVQANKLLPNPHPPAPPKKKQWEKYNSNPDLGLGLDQDLLRRRNKIQIKHVFAEKEKH